MRTQLLKLQRGKSTKAERVFSEILKSQRIPFRTKVKIHGYEVDFLVNEKFIVEINGHEQDSSRNNVFVKYGFIPLHFSNNEVLNNKLLITQKIINYDY